MHVPDDELEHFILKRLKYESEVDSLTISTDATERMALLVYIEGRNALVQYEVRSSLSSPGELGRGSESKSAVTDLESSLLAPGSNLVWLSPS